jgi:hypothetical protein
MLLQLGVLGGIRSRGPVIACLSFGLLTEIFLVGRKPAIAPISSRSRAVSDSESLVYCGQEQKVEVEGAARILAEHFDLDDLYWVMVETVRRKQ